MIEALANKLLDADNPVVSAMGVVLLLCYLFIRQLLSNAEKREEAYAALSRQHTVLSEQQAELIRSYQENCEKCKRELEELRGTHQRRVKLLEDQIREYHSRLLQLGLMGGEDVQ